MIAKKTTLKEIGEMLAYVVEHVAIKEEPFVMSLRHFGRKLRRTPARFALKSQTSADSLKSCRLA